MIKIIVIKKHKEHTAREYQPKGMGAHTKHSNVSIKNDRGPTCACIFHSMAHVSYVNLVFVLSSLLYVYDNQSIWQL